MYLLELVGDEDAFAACEAASIASDVSLFAPGLATARGVDRARVRGLAYTRRASDLVGYADPRAEDAHALLEAASIEREGTVAVRARDVRGSTGIDTQQVERELGAVLTDRGFVIDLDAPDHELRAISAAPMEPATDRLTADLPVDDSSAGDGVISSQNEGDEVDGICALGWLVAESTRGFGERQPTKKPFFQPGSMDPLFARWLANVAGAGPGKRLLDPMCGTGGILVEAGLVGANVVGLDAQSKMVRGTRRNLTHYLGENGRGRDDVDEESGADGADGDERRQHTREFAALRGDATRIPLREGTVDGVCFDVPYGRQSKITGDLEALVAGALTEARRLAPRTVIVGDRPWIETARDAGWKVESTFERRVHRSLTRHIAVLDST